MGSGQLVSGDHSSCMLVEYWQWEYKMEEKIVDDTASNVFQFFAFGALSFLLGSGKKKMRRYIYWKRHWTVSTCAPDEVIEEWVTDRTETSWGQPQDDPGGWSWSWDPENFDSWYDFAESWNKHIAPGAGLTFEIPLDEPSFGRKDIEVVPDERISDNLIDKRKSDEAQGMDNAQSSSSYSDIGPFPAAGYGNPYLDPLSSVEEGYLKSRDTKWSDFKHTKVNIVNTVFTGKEWKQFANWYQAVPGAERSLSALKDDKSYKLVSIKFGFDPLQDNYHPMATKGQFQFSVTFGYYLMMLREMQ